MIRDVKRFLVGVPFAFALTTWLAAQSLAPDVVWRTKLPAQPHTPPVTAPDGRIVTIVKAYERGIGDFSQLVVLAADGDRRVVVRQSDGLGSMPVVAPNGIIYALGSGGRVDAIALDGRILWSYVVTQAGQSEHHVTWSEVSVRDSDSAAFVAGRCVHALASTGARLWRTCLGEPARAPRYAEDSLFVRSGGQFHRLGNDGKLLWSAYVGPGRTAAVFDGRGMAYVASGKTVQAVAITTGVVAWRTQVRQDIGSLGWSESAQLIVLQQRRLDVFDGKGQPRWQWTTGDDVLSGPVVVAKSGDFFAGGSAVRRFGPDGPVAGFWRHSNQYTCSRRPCRPMVERLCCPTSPKGCRPSGCPSLDEAGHLSIGLQRNSLLLNQTVCGPAGRSWRRASRGTAGGGRLERHGLGVAETASSESGLHARFRSGPATAMLVVGN